jgi:hypothetical protein
MKTYTFSKKDEFGNELYLDNQGTFSANPADAKEIRLKWWEWLFKILSQLVKLYGNGQLKLKK